MAAYHYIALSQDGKELSGIISADNDAQARSKLNGLGLSIVSLEQTNEVSSMPTHPTKKTYEFSAIDKNGKKVVGTIASDDPTEAYTRLFSQYKLDVVGLSADGTAIDLAPIQETYQKLHAIDNGTTWQNAEGNSLSHAENEQRQELLTKVDFTMSRIEEFLKIYGPDLKIDERDTIQAYINQLIRIKDSTNLEHIRVTCEKMLEHIQKQELFIYEEQKAKESTKIKVETHELLSSLKRTGLKQDIDIVGSLSKLREKAFFKPIADFFLRLFYNHIPEVRQTRNEIKGVRRYMWQYLIVAVTGKNKIIRHEAWQTIKTMRLEVSRLKLKLHGLIQEEKARMEVSATPSRFGEYVRSGAGWMLAMYLVFYAVTYPFTIKEIAVTLPSNLYFYYGTLPKYLTLFLFLLYAAMQLKHLFLPGKKLAALVLYPTSMILYLLIVINLL